VQGFNSRLDPLQAAVLRVKLKSLDDWNGRRKHIATMYLEMLDMGALTLPFVPNYADPVWHLFVVRRAKREELQQRLSEAGIGTMIHYPIPPHRQQAYADFDISSRAFPIAQAIANEVLSLPIGPHLLPEFARDLCATMKELVHA